VPEYQKITNDGLTRSGTECSNTQLTKISWALKSQLFCTELCIASVRDCKQNFIHKTHASAERVEVNFPKTLHTILIFVPILTSNCWKKWSMQRDGETLGPFTPRFGGAGSKAIRHFIATSLFWSEITTSSILSNIVNMSCNSATHEALCLL